MREYTVIRGLSLTEVQTKAEQLMRSPRWIPCGGTVYDMKQDCYIATFIMVNDYRLRNFFAWMLIILTICSIIGGAFSFIWWLLTR